MRPLRLAAALLLAGLLAACRTPPAPPAAGPEEAAGTTDETAASPAESDAAPATPPAADPAPDTTPAVEPAPPARADDGTPPFWSAGDCRAQLAVVADCFFQTVTQIQEEPAAGEPLAAFLGKATWQVAAASVHDACVRLGLGPEAERLVLADGSEVVYEKGDVAHDDFAGGISQWHIPYVFRTETCPDGAATTITLQVGGSPE